MYEPAINLRLPRPENEELRLEVVQRYNILDTPPEGAFDELARLASRYCNTPVALISIIDKERVWYKSKLGLDVAEIPRDRCLCSLVILKNEPLVITDLLTFEGYASLYPSFSELGLRFYAGIPLINAEGFGLGTLCVLDTVPRNLSAEQLDTLQSLSRQVVVTLEMRRTAYRLYQANEELQQQMEERRLAEEALANERDLLKMLTDNIPDTFYLKDRRSRFCRINLSQAKALGLADPLEAVGKTDFDFFPIEFAITTYADEQVIIRTGEPLIDKVEGYHRGNEPYHWLLTTKMPIKDQTGQISGIVGISRDITELKRIDEALAMDDSRMEALLKLYTMTDASLQQITDFALEEGVRLTSSQIGFLAFTNEDESMLQIHSWSKLALKNSMVNDKSNIIPVADAGLWAEAIRQRRPIITNDYSEASASRRGLPIVHAPINRHMNVPIFDGEHIVALAGVANKEQDYDISDVRQLTLLFNGMWQLIQHRRQQDDLAKLSLAVEQSPSIIIITDTTGIIEYINEQFTKVTGYARDEVIGKDVRELHSPEQNEAPMENMWTIVSEGKEWQGVFRNRKKNGESYWEEAHVSPIHNAAGKITHFLKVSEDITLRRQMEEEILKTRKLEALGILAGGIAHDFNNMLTAILGNISYAQLHAVNENGVGGSLKEAEQACLRARGLTQQLLAFSKGGAPIKETASISEVIREAATFALHGSNSALSLALPDDLAAAEIDPGQISQVIHNLVINADQATPNGGMVTINAENTSIAEGDAIPVKPGRYIKIEVIDQGSGIAPENISRIFDPYFTTKQKGSGLGLSITYSIIKNHDGHISVRSKLNEGTTFQIFLPASDKPLAKKEITLPVLKEGKGRILVMDDESSIRNILRRVLGGSGYSPELVQNGEEALACFSEAQNNNMPFDAVILDLTIPGGMGGKDTIKRLRAMDPGIKAIVSSGYSNDPIMANYKEYGFDAVVAKPFAIEQLLSTLYQLLNNN